jgi:spore germination protein KC
MFIPALVALLLLSCTGCWDRKELNQISACTMIGFDRVVRNGKPLILMSVLSLKLNAGLSGGGAGGGAATYPPSLGVINSAEGETVGDALRNMSLRSPKAIFLGHVEVVIIGEDMARNGIQQVIDFCGRNKEIRYRIDMAVCQGSALEALESQPEFETLNSVEALKIIRSSSSRSSKAVPANLFQVVYALLTPGKDVAMPRMVVFLPPERGSTIRKGAPSGASEESGKQGGGAQGQQGSTGGAQGGGAQGQQAQQGSTGLQGVGAQGQQEQFVQLSQQGRQGITGAQSGGTQGGDFNQALGAQEALHPDWKAMAVDGSAVFLGDRLVGWLNENESMGAMFITRQASGGEIPFAFRSSEPNATYIFRSVHASVKPVVGNGSITYEISLKGSGELAEDKNAAIDVMSESDIRAAEQLIDAEVAGRCQDAVATCQSLKSDVFGFGDLLHKSDPAFWRQINDRWRDYFPNVKVQVHADFTIEHAGAIGEAIKISKTVSSPPSRADIF